MIYLCGDLHGDIDIHKLSSKLWPEGHKLTKSDILIVLGDFGLFWRGRGDEWWLKWLNNKPWTTWFIPGNHENYDILDKFPIEEQDEFLRLGVTPYESIRMICHGSIIEIGGKKLFCFGGADSVDKHERIEGFSWWKQEIPSYQDQERAFHNLEKVGYSVDYILTHAVYQSVLDRVNQEQGLFSYKTNDPVTKVLQEIHDRTKFQHWYCGHYHIDYTDEEYRTTFLYDREPMRII
ncbi:MAG: metallophosphoesterase [Brevinematales bacterium]|nr:metallophosphoesterase [Brevinematales bacterium]